MKIRTLIVDDDPDSRVILRSFFETQYPAIQIVGEAGTAREAKAIIEARAPDLLLLDIVMPDESAFELLRQVKERNFEVIFITAHNEYAIRAFKEAAIDYLLKPVNFLELAAALTRVLERVGQKNFSRQWKVLEENLKEKESPNRRLAVAGIDGYVFLTIHEIMRLESSSNYTFLFTAQGAKITSSKTLGYYEEILPASDFVRIHHSHMVNIHFVSKYLKDSGGGTVVLQDGSTICVSLRKKNQFMERMRPDIRF